MVFFQLLLCSIFNSSSFKVQAPPFCKFYCPTRLVEILVVGNAYFAVLLGTNVDIYSFLLGSSWGCQCRFLFLQLPCTGLQPGLRWLFFNCLLVTVKSRFSCVFVCIWSEGCFEVCLQEWKVESYSPGSRCKQDDWNSPLSLQESKYRCRCRYCTLRYRCDLDVTSFGHGPYFSGSTRNPHTDGILVRTISEHFLSVGMSARNSK